MSAGLVGPLIVVAVAAIFVGSFYALDRPVKLPPEVPLECHAAPTIPYTPEQAHRVMQERIDCDTATCRQRRVLDRRRRWTGDTGKSVGPMNAVVRPDVLARWQVHGQNCTATPALDGMKHARYLLTTHAGHGGCEQYMAALAYGSGVCA